MDLEQATQQAAAAEQELRQATQEVQRATRRLTRHLQELTIETMRAEQAQARLARPPVARVPRGRRRDP